MPRHAHLRSAAPASQEARNEYLHCIPKILIPLASIQPYVYARRRSWQAYVMHRESTVVSTTTAKSWLPLFSLFSYVLYVSHFEKRRHWARQIYYLSLYIRRLRGSSIVRLTFHYSPRTKTT